MMKTLTLSILLLALSGAAQATNTPILFFSDLILGSATANTDTTYSASGNGVYVTLYGNFLDNYASVKLNGASCLTVVSPPSAWLWYERMIVQIGSSCTTGNFSITTPGGTWNGPMPSTVKEQRTYDFTVVTAHIYYVASGGGGAGTFSSPFATINTAEYTMADGDVTYVKGGTWTATDAQGQAIVGPTSAVCTQSTSSQRAFVGYPGTATTWGTTSSGPVSFEPYSSPCHGYEFAELTLRDPEEAIAAIAGSNQVSGNFRFVGLDMSCPSGDGEDGCFGDGGGASGGGDTSYVDGIITYGIYIHNTGAGGTTLYHAIYDGTTSGIIHAWDEIAPLVGNSGGGVCNGIQLYTSNGSFVQSDVHVHDEMITGASCSGVLFGGNIDPSITSGTLYGGGGEMYNNVLWNDGVSSGRDCIQFAAAKNTTNSVETQFYNNTMYNCASGGSGEGLESYPYTSGCAANSCELNFNNNILNVLISSDVYAVHDSGASSAITGANNDLYGNGAVNSSTVTGPGWALTGYLNVDPQFVSTSIPNFAPSSASSPVVGAGSTTTGPVPTYDITGLVRPSPPSIGAYEYAAGLAAAPPLPPTNLTVVVH